MALQPEYNKAVPRTLKGKYQEIADFTAAETDNNIDLEVVKSFGDEWSKFRHFSAETLQQLYSEYFDIIDERIVNKNSRIIDIGCGTGRWSEYFLDKAGYIEAVDPSDAVFAADELLQKRDNLRITRASVKTLPWDDETFDMGMSIGVLHHIPDTEAALVDCVKKIKKGGYFYVYLYYRFDKRGSVFKTIFYMADFIRRIVSHLPSGLKKLSCEILAVAAYMPFVWTARLLYKLGMPKTAASLPLSNYANKPFYIIRNDSLDRFGTKLEHRFTKEEIRTMMERAGLGEIVFSEKVPFWHAVGKRMQ